jgi:hypothetical protein
MTLRTEAAAVRKLNACERKKPYETKGEAEAAGQAYRCPYCQKWHAGNLSFLNFVRGLHERRTE